jgi:hypothetical protein
MTGGWQLENWKLQHKKWGLSTTRNSNAFGTLPVTRLESAE